MIPEAEICARTELLYYLKQFSISLFSSRDIDLVRLTFSLFLIRSPALYSKVLFIVYCKGRRSLHHIHVINSLLLNRSIYKCPTGYFSCMSSCKGIYAQGMSHPYQTMHSLASLEIKCWRTQHVLPVRYLLPFFFSLVSPLIKFGITAWSYPLDVMLCWILHLLAYSYVPNFNLTLISTKKK